MEPNQKKGGVILSYIMLISNVLIKFIYTPFLLRNLGQEEYGLYSLAITIIGYLTLLDLGFGSAIVRFTIKYKNDNDRKRLHEIYGMMSVLYLIIGFVALLVSFCIYFNVENLFGSSMTELEVSKMKIMILLTGFNLLFSFPLQIASSVLIAYEKFIFRNGVNFIKMIFVPFSMVVFILLLDFKSVGLIVIVTFFNIITYLVFYIYAFKKLDFRISFIKIDPLLLKSIIGFSSSVFLLMIYEQLQFNSGHFFLGINMGTKEVAIWGIAMVFVLNYRSISTAITNVFTPSIISMVYKNDKTYITNSIFRFVRIQTYVLLITLLNFILFGQDFIVLWAGDQYQEVYQISLIIMIPMTFALLLDFGYIIQIANNSFKYRIITLFLSFITAFILINELYGITLKSYAFIVSLSLLLGQIIFMIFYINYIIKFNIWLIIKNIIKISLFPLIYTLLFHIFQGKIHLILNFEIDIYKFIISIVIYNIGMVQIYWFLCFSTEERSMVLKKRNKYRSL